MPIPANQQLVADVQMNGTVAAGGSNNRLTAWHFFFLRPVSTVAINKANVETAFNASIVPSLLAALNLRYTQTTTGVRCLNDATDPYLEVSRTGVGAITGDSMATFVNAYILVRTTQRGKSYRASKHFFPLSESDTTTGTDDILNAAALARWATFNAAWLAGFTDSGGNVWTPVIFQKTISVTRTNPTFVYTVAINQLITRKSIGRMKRREVKSVY